MPRYAALLRGINVGKAKPVAMADLRALLEGLGYTDVQTLLRSGNAVFTAARAQPQKLERAIEAALAKQLGMEVSCLVRSERELRAVIAADPFGDAASDGSKYLALFLSAQPGARLLAAHDPRELAPDEIRVGKRVIYQWCPNGFLEAPSLGPFVEKHLKVRATGRNWNTVKKLAALADG
jgi:uncharacterized protein (DUF1697 family)